MSLEALLTNYGYLAVFIGTFLQFDSILILGGLAAHRGYLDLPWVIVWAFLATIISDQLIFLLGRTKGKDILSKRASWQAQSARVLSILNRHQVWFILLFRFFYGIRAVTPLLIGMSGVRQVRFTLLNLLGGFLWATVMGPLGYLFGNAMQSLFGNIKQHELSIFLGVMIIMILVRFAIVLKQRAALRK
ncbi:MAG TPA: DedA family protein [Xanthomonadales bacterium]|nr:DedA family protein [Xanthomonadales bacterium]